MHPCLHRREMWPGQGSPSRVPGLPKRANCPGMQLSAPGWRARPHHGAQFATGFARIASPHPLPITFGNCLACPELLGGVAFDSTDPGMDASAATKTEDLWVFAYGS